MNEIMVYKHDAPTALTIPPHNGLMNDEITSRPFVSVVDFVRVTAFGRLTPERSWIAYIAFIERDIIFCEIARIHDEFAVPEVEIDMNIELRR